MSLALLLCAPAAAEVSGRVDTTVGVVEVGTGDPPVWSAARAGDPVRPGDRVRTGPDGRAELRLGRGSIRLYENSLLHVPAAAPTDGQRVDLERGASLFDVQKHGGGASGTFQVHTPEAVAMVKGTRFAVSVDAAGAAVSVYRGLVGVRPQSTELAHELLVRPGSTAIGGPDDAFALRLLPPGADPWAAWGDGGSPPEAPATLLGPKQKRAPLRLARASARAAAKRMTPDAVASAQSMPAAPAHSTGESETTAQTISEDEPATDDVSRFDAGVDTGAWQTLTTSYAQELVNAAAAGETLVVSVPSPLWVKVVSSGGTVNQSLSVSNLYSIQLGGNTSLYDPDLVTILNAQSIDPQDYAGQLLAVLGF